MPSASALAEDFLAGLGPPGVGLGFGSGGGAQPTRPAISDDEECSDDEGVISKRAAKKRRKQQLSEAEAIAQQPIESGFGHAMLLKMGWGGTGQALQDGGISEPVKAAIPAGKRGLAADEDLAADSLDAARATSGKSSEQVAGDMPSKATAAAAQQVESDALAAALGIDVEARRGSKRARKAGEQEVAAAPTSRSWRLDLELSVAADEETVRATMLDFPNVLCVEATRMA